MSMKVALHSKALLGESPIWCERDQALYWVDIRGREIRRFDPATGEDRAWKMPEDIGSIGFRQNGGFVAALRSGFAFFDPKTGALECLHNPIAGRRDLRFNDGRCDRAGRFWAGTVQEKRVAGLAALYRFDPDRRCTLMADGITVANGTAWSPDDRTMYFADSWTREIYAYDFDLRAGTIANRRVFARFGDDEGIPDGATVDVDGNLWIAHFDGWRVTRFAPDGRVDRVVEMPVPRPTSCAFGGRDLNVLYVTSASFSLTEEMLARAPLSGAIFALDVR
ncbi:MAG TPA: SMP-30/gluconolactonase/LRE family protein, partial [Alphaproteobacteria bacterium]|nr:SMP-30/gluconolactonase/LRE family protein [Alphaproteobacteria bacterium]